jgi:sugar O-acyltransferase (sialic acid O-acetyltransferase NeuD family)
LCTFIRKYSILKSIESAREYFEREDNRFVLGLGNPIARYELYEKFNKLGGVLTSTISKNCRLGSFSVKVGSGTSILSGVKISNDVKIGEGCLIYYNSVITHDCCIGNFVQLSPGATLLGNVIVGSFSQIGSNATILPNISIGKNVTVGAGAVVIENVPDNSVVVGVPAKLIKSVDPLNFKNDFNSNG